MPFLYYAAVWVASILLTEALRPKPEQNDPDPLDPADVSIPQAEEGGAVAISYGTCELTGPTILDAWNLDVRRVTEEMDTGLFSSTEVFKYDELRLSVDLSLGTGFSESDLAGGSAITRITLDDKTIVDTAQDTPITTDDHGATYYIDRPTLWGDEASGGVQGGLRIFHGRPTQPVDPYLLATRSWNTAHRGLLRCVFGYPVTVPIFANTPLAPLFGLNPTGPLATTTTVRNFLWNHSSSLPQPKVVVRRTPRPAALTLPPGVHEIDGGANPACVLFELFTRLASDPLSTSEIDTAAFRTAAILFKAEGLGVNLLLNNQQPLTTVKAEIEKATDSVCEIDPSSGLLTIRTIRDTNPIAATFTISNILAASKLTTPAIDLLPTRIRLRYTSNTDFTQKTLSLENAALLAQGATLRTLDSTSSLLGTEAAAATAAQRQLIAATSLLPTISLTTTRTAAPLGVGMRVLVDAPELLQLPPLICRITRLKRNPSTAQGGTLELELVADGFDKATAAPTPATPTAPAPLGGIALLSAYATEIPTELGTGYTIIATKAAGLAADFKTDTGTTSSAFACTEALTAALTPTATSLSFSATTPAAATITASPSLKAAKRCLALIRSTAPAAAEWVAFDAAYYNPTTATATLDGLERGLFGSTPADFTAGATIHILPTTTLPLLTTPPATATPRSSAGNTGPTLTAVAAFHGLNARPYPPVNVAATQQSPTLISVSFTTRDRSACAASPTLVLKTDPAQPTTSIHHLTITDPADPTAPALWQGTVNSGDSLTLPATATERQLTLEIKAEQAGAFSLPVRTTMTQTP